MASLHRTGFQVRRADGPGGSPSGQKTDRGEAEAAVTQSRGTQAWHPFSSPVRDDQSRSPGSGWTMAGKGVPCGSHCEPRASGQRVEVKRSELGCRLPHSGPRNHGEEGTFKSWRRRIQTCSRVQDRERQRAGGERGLQPRPCPPAPARAGGKPRPPELHHEGRITVRPRPWSRPQDAPGEESESPVETPQIHRREQQDPGSGQRVAGTHLCSSPQGPGLSPAGPTRAS